jgi:hypothetical protein
MSRTLRTPNPPKKYQIEDFQLRGEGPGNAAQRKLADGRGGPGISTGERAGPPGKTPLEEPKPSAGGRRGSFKLPDKPEGAG